jgi:3'-5' exoribonuclease
MKNKSRFDSPVLVKDIYQLKRFKGCYYLVGFSARMHARGFPFWEIVISDSSGTLSLYCLDQSCIFGGLQPQSLVHVEGGLDQSGTAAFFRCKAIFPSENNNFTLRSVSQLPSKLCSYPESLNGLVKLIASIKNESLRQFINDVILSPSIAISYITCPASLRYHHNYRSGLLVHSVEVANSTSNDNSLSDEQKDIAIVSALLHDIGKTQTLTADLQRTAKGQLIDHDDLTLELCGEALAKLDESHSYIANQLRHAWTCKSPGARYGFKAKTKVAKRLMQCDRQSANLINAIN